MRLITIDTTACYGTSRPASPRSLASPSARPEPTRLPFIHPPRPPSGACAPSLSRFPCRTVLRRPAARPRARGSAPSLTGFKTRCSAPTARSNAATRPPVLRSGAVPGPPRLTPLRQRPTQRLAVIDHKRQSPANSARCASCITSWALPIAAIVNARVNVYRQRSVPRHTPSSTSRACFHLCRWRPSWTSCNFSSGRRKAGRAEKAEAEPGVRPSHTTPPSQGWDRIRLGLGCACGRCLLTR